MATAEGAWETEMECTCHIRLGPQPYPLSPEEVAENAKLVADLLIAAAKAIREAEAPAETPYQVY